MSKIEISFCVVLVFIFMGCSSIPSTSLPTELPTLDKVTIPPTLSSETATSVVPSATESSTSTPNPLPFTATTKPTSTPTANLQITPTIPPEARLDYQCLEINSNLPKIGMYAGTIVLAGYSETPTYLLDLSTMDMKTLLGEKDEKSIFWTVSPDRKWLAYYLLSSEELIVENIGGKEQPITHHWEQHWVAILQWLDNQNLLISLGGAYSVFNPFTGERRGLVNDFQYYAVPYGVGANWWGVVYNPSLTRAVYPSDPAFVNANGEFGKIVLWNMQTNKFVTSLSSFSNPWGWEPVWSPNGKELIIALGQEGPPGSSVYNELYKVSLDGQQTKLTYINAIHSKWSMISHYSWSPDARQIAFWLDINLGTQLAILNLDTMLVTNYCIDLANVEEPPIWSPDGRQLVIPTYNYSKDTVTFDIVLIDLEENVAFMLTQGNFRPVGWMVNP